MDTENLSDYFVLFCDKIFKDLSNVPNNIIKCWRELRLLLNKKPIDLEKIKVFIQKMSEIKPNEKILDTGENEKINDFTNNSLASRKKSQPLFLKKKSTVTIENQINLFYFNDRIDPTFSEPSSQQLDNLEDEDNHHTLEQSFTAFSSQDFNFNDQKAEFTSSTNKSFEFDTKKLIKKVNEFKDVFSQNSITLDKNFENIINEMNAKKLELNQNLSISNKVVEMNLKNYSFYFIETYEKVKNQLNLL